MKFDSKNPCTKGCKDRYAGCHGHCEKEAAYKAAIADREARILKAKDKDKHDRDYVIDAIRRVKRYSK